MFERTTIVQIRCDPRRPKRMIADRRENAGADRPPTDHAPGIGLHHGLLGQHGCVVSRAGAEQKPLLVRGDAGDLDVGPQRLFLL